MNNPIRYGTLLSGICLLLFFVASVSGSNGSLHIRFVHQVGDQPLRLDTVTYLNEKGQPFTVTKFKYYISHMTLLRNDGRSFSSPDYFLVDEDDSSSKEIDLKNIPSGTYTGISFMIGVDSLHNCSGIQSGALDPVHGMFWTWNTGYIFLKLEGRAANSGQPGHVFEYHIGGFREPANAIRTTTLDFAGPLKMDQDEQHTLVLKADVSELFKTPVTIDIAAMPSVTDRTHASLVADNYRDMFSVIRIY